MESNIFINFLYKNILSIIFVVAIFSCITIIIILYDIKFPEKKEQIDEVIVIENYTPKITANSLAQQSENSINSEKICNQLNNMKGCLSLKSCVWVNATPDKKKIEKCVPANKILDNKTNPPAGSDGPLKTCFKHKNKLIPWENFFYDDGGLEKSKKILNKKC